MKPRHSPPSIHVIWRKIRGPFRVISCKDHQWEMFDVQHAGCLACGCLHVCSNSMADNECPLVHLEDGGVCCPITGYCAPVVRYSDNEYIENVTYTHAKVAKPQQQIPLDEVLHVVKWFLLGQVSVSCKVEETSKFVARMHACFVKTLKQHKLSTAQRSPRTLPCLCTMFAQTFSQQRPKHLERPSEDLCRFCATHVSQCLNSLSLANVQARKVNLVVGMLYLMKQGLVIQNVQWLPKVPALCNCLPHETSLEKVFKLSMKLVCETENEIKLALRQRVKLL